MCRFISHLILTVCLLFDSLSIVIIRMVFEGKGKSWRDHPSINQQANLRRALPGFKYALIGFGIYVVIDQIASFMS